MSQMFYIYFSGFICLQALCIHLVDFLFSFDPAVSTALFTALYYFTVDLEWLGGSTEQHLTSI